MNKSIKRDKEVVVIAGANKGKRGKVLEVDSKKLRVIIEGANIIKKHTRPTQDNPDGDIVNIEGPIHVSNVMLADDYEKRKNK